MTIELTYPEILSVFGKHLVPTRAESRAFLSWFLEHFFRLDLQSAQDAICDGPNDKGIDGIFVDSNLERIHVFQAKLYQSSNKTLGDSALREFSGAMNQLDSKQKIEVLAQETGNIELANLLVSEDIATKVEEGYEVRGTFITNVEIDANGKLFADNNDQLSVIGKQYLTDNWIDPNASDLMKEEVRFALDGLGAIRYRTPEAEVVVASLRGSQLVKMAGIESQELFEWNVRQTLGRTKVNKAIAESIHSQSEHKNFLLYHNGLTILAEDVNLDEKEDELVIDGYAVVNGCQSLSTLYDNKSTLSDELRVLGRVIKLPPHSELASKITRHSNNQNSINARDLQANSTTQRRLQSEFEATFGKEIGYEIKRGEAVESAHTISNDTAAKYLLAFDLEQPWSCHQSYKLFDSLHNDIFNRPEVNAKRIAILYVFDLAIDDCLSNIDDKLLASYSLTRFFLLFLLKKAIGVDEGGQTILERPSLNFGDAEFSTIREAALSVLSDLTVDLNAEVAEREENRIPFDYKRELKSSTAVRSVAKEIISNYTKSIKRNRINSFSKEILYSDAGDPNVG